MAKKDVILELINVNKKYEDSYAVENFNLYVKPQQGGFAAAGWAAKHHKFPGMHRQRQIVNDILRLIGIGKT